MRIDILTLFPQMFEGPFSESIIRRARERGYVEIVTHDIRNYSTDKHNPVNLETISKDRAFHIIELNKKGKKPSKLVSEAEAVEAKGESIQNDLLGDQSITRFDKKDGGSTSKRRKPRRGRQDNRNRKGKPPKQNEE